MTRQEAKKIMENEVRCVRNPNCERLECRNCYLVMPEHTVLKAYDVAIKALEQETCEDTISRQAAVYVASGYCHPANVADELAKLPSVNPQEPKTGWIPVSERLPKIADVYRVTRYYPNNVMNPKYLVDACAFNGSNIWYNDNRINHERAYADNVIAWQENPEPYMPQESEDQE